MMNLSNGTLSISTRTVVEAMSGVQDDLMFVYNIKKHCSMAFKLVGQPADLFTALKPQQLHFIIFATLFYQQS